MENKQEPIDKLYERAKKALLVMRKLDRHQTKYNYDDMLSKMFEVWGDFLDRLVYLEAIQMFGDLKLMEKK